MMRSKVVWQAYRLMLMVVPLSRIKIMKTIIRLKIPLMHARLFISVLRWQMIVKLLLKHLIVWQLIIKTLSNLKRFKKCKKHCGQLMLASKISFKAVQQQPLSAIILISK